MNPLPEFTTITGERVAINPLQVSHVVRRSDGMAEVYLGSEDLSVIIDGYEEVVAAIDGWLAFSRRSAESS